MTSTTDPQWDTIIKTWGHACTLGHDTLPAADERYSARSQGANGIRHAALLEAIKADAARIFAPGGTP